MAPRSNAALALLRRLPLKSLSAAFLAAALLEYRRRWLKVVRTAVELRGLEGPKKALLRHLVQRSPTLSAPLRETSLPFHTHGLVHTTLAMALVDAVTPPVVFAERQLVELPDGGTVGVDWLPPSVPRAGPNDGPAPLLFVVHGLAGNAQEAHERRLAHHFSAKGWEVAAFNMRGSGGVPVTSAKFSTLWTGAEEVSAALEAVRARRPESPLAIVCISMGAAITIRMLGQVGQQLDAGSQDRLRVSGVVSLSCPVDVEASSKFLHGSFVNRLVAIYLAQRLKLIMHKAGVPVPWTAIDVQDMEREVVCKQHGLPQTDEGVLQYYRGGSAKGLLKSVHAPLLLLTAEDDPVIDPMSIPRKEVTEECDNVVLAVTPRGGHVGFLTRDDWRDLLQSAFRGQEARRKASAATWLPVVCEEFLSACVAPETKAVQSRSAEVAAAFSKL